MESMNNTQLTLGISDILYVIMHHTSRYMLYVYPLVNEKWRYVTARYIAEKKIKLKGRDKEMCMLVYGYLPDNISPSLESRIIAGNMKYIKCDEEYALAAASLGRNDILRKIVESRVPENVLQCISICGDLALLKQVLNHYYRTGAIEQGLIYSLKYQRYEITLLLIEKLRSRCVRYECVQAMYRECVKNDDFLSICALGAVFIAPYISLSYIRSMEMLDYMISLGATPNSSMYSGAVRSGNIELLEYMRRKYGYPLESHLYTDVGDSSEMMEYLMNNGCELDNRMMNRYFWKTIYSSNLNILRYMLSKGLAITDIYHMAIAHDNLDAVKIIHEHGVVWRENDYDVAIKGECYKIVRWVLKKDKPSDLKTAIWTMLVGTKSPASEKTLLLLESLFA